MLKVVIKNADGITADFPLNVKIGACVLDLKKSISEEYSGRPGEERMKIVFSGRLLRDSDAVEDLLQSHDLSSPPIFHLLLRPCHDGEQAAPPSPSVSTPKACASASSAPTTPCCPTDAQAGTPSPAPPGRTTPASPAVAAAIAAMERIAQQQQQSNTTSPQQPTTEAQTCPQTPAARNTTLSFADAVAASSSPTATRVSSELPSAAQLPPAANTSPTPPRAHGSLREASSPARATTSAGSTRHVVPRDNDAMSAPPCTPTSRTALTPTVATPHTPSLATPTMSLGAFSTLSPASGITPLTFPTTLPGGIPPGLPGMFPGAGLPVLGFPAVWPGLGGASLVDAVAMQQHVQKVYYEAYYKAYLQHFMAAMEDETLAQGEPHVAQTDQEVSRSEEAFTDPNTTTGTESSSCNGHDCEAHRGVGDGDDASDGRREGHRREGLGGEGGPDRGEGEDVGGARGEDLPPHLLPGVRARGHQLLDEQAELHARHQDLAAAGGRTLHLALKLVFVVFLLGQDAPRERLYIICAFALCIFLHQTGFLRVFSWLYLPQQQALEDQYPEQDAQDRGDAGGGGDGVFGLLSDVTALVIGFFTSLIPRAPAGVLAN